MAESERRTFSALWHRVRELAPTLRPQVQVMRQRHRGQVWHVLHDPTSGQFFRVDDAGWSFVGRLDGRQTVEALWNRLIEHDADEAPTQGDVVALLGRLSAANLVRHGAPIETEQLLKRSGERTAQRAKSSLMNVLFVKIPIFNPDAIVAQLEPIFRPLIGRTGFAAWCAFMAFIVIKLLPERGQLMASFADAIAPANVGWLLAMYIIAKTVHEFGHAVVLRRFGGQVPECGIMLLVFAPSPYVDASTAWALGSAWKRAAVGGAGMIFELALAGGAALVWLWTAPGQVVHQLAFNTMLTAGVSTVLFNANPLMRFDGYFIASDLLGMPNMMQRSFQLLKHAFVKGLFGAEKPEAPAIADARERGILVVYGLAAIAYRVVLFYGITMVLMDRLFGIGVVLAMWTGAVWVIGPMVKFVRYLVSDPVLVRSRGRAVLMTGAIIVVSGAAVGFVPMADTRSVPGVLASETKAHLYVSVAGRVVTGNAHEGDWVEHGQVLVALENQELAAQLSAARAELEVVEGVERMTVDRRPELVDLAQQRVSAQRLVVEHLERQVAMLTVRAPHAGVVVQGDPAGIVGAWVTAGDAICAVIDTQHVRIDASAAQRDAAWLGTMERDAYVIEVRRLSDIERVIVCGEIEVAPGGQRSLSHAALAATGGGQVAVEASDATGRTAMRRRFPVRIWAEGLQGSPGERVRVRFVLPKRPLMAQWGERVARIVQERVRL